MSRLDLNNLLIVIWIFATIDSVECLMCVQCSSLFERECISGDMAPTNCSTESEYCTMYEGTVKLTGDKFVIRDCSPEIEKPGCRDKVFQEKDVKICYTSCQTDGCNGASKNTSTHWIMYIISAFCIAYATADLFM